MTLLQLMYFVEVSNSGSTLKAAQCLNVSQSTISSAIKALESELDIVLFNRTPKGMLLNDAGTHFLCHAKSILEEAENTVSDMKRYQKGRNSIRLGMTSVVCLSYWPDLSIALKQYVPGVGFEVVNDTTSALTNMLSKNVIDGMIAPFVGEPDETCSTFHSIYLKSNSTQSIAMSIKHPLAKEASLTYEQIACFPLIGYKGDDGKICELRREFANIGLELNYVQRCDQLATLIHLVRRNCGIAYLTPYITKDYPDLISVPIQGAHPRKLYLLWAKSNAPSALPKKVIHTITDFFASSC